MGFDLADYGELDATEFSVEIDNPKTGQPTGITIRVAGSWGDLARLGQRILAAKVKEAQDKGIDLGLLERTDIDLCDPKVVEAEHFSAGALTAMMKPRIKGWSGMVWKGEELPFTPDNLKMVFDNPSFYWLAAQIYSKAESQGSFTKASSETSAKPSKTE